MTDDVCGSVKSLHQGSDEIGFNTEVKCPGPRPMRSTAVATEIGRNHFKVCPKSRGKFGPLATRVTRTMQKHDRLSSTDGWQLMPPTSMLVMLMSCSLFRHAARMDA